MAEITFTLTQSEYESLIALARAGTKDAEGQVLPESARRLDEFLKSVEKNNGITRSALWVQWQEMDQPLPPTMNFPDVWPPEMRYYIELVSRLVSRADVDTVIAAHAKNPISIVVTADPGARVGWQTLDQFFTSG